MLILQNLSYKHPDKDPLFNNVNLTVNTYYKVALVGNNGIGKSTAVKILAGKLKPNLGNFKVSLFVYSFVHNL